MTEDKGSEFLNALLGQLERNVSQAVGGNDLGKLVELRDTLVQMPRTFKMSSAQRQEIERLRQVTLNALASQRSGR